MINQPARPSGGTLERYGLLFTPGARLGWTFRSRRDLIPPYPEQPPDPEATREQAAARLDAAQRSWQRSWKWAARPSLVLAIALMVLAGCAHALNPGAPLGTTIITAFIVAMPGLGWTGWRYAQFQSAKSADPERQYQVAHEEWAQRAAAFEQAELTRLENVPEWGSAEPPTQRTDVFGGTLAGWQSLLTVHGASIMAAQPLLVADLSGQHAAGTLIALARDARVQIAEYILPRDMDRCGLLADLTPRQLADALAEAIHAGPPGAARADRAVDVRVLEQLGSALSANGVTPARLAAAVQAALGRPVPAGLLTKDETDQIRGELFGSDYKTQIGANLVRLDAFISDLAAHAGTGPPASPAPAYCTLLAIEPAARSARAELTAALVIQWLTIQVTASTANAPAVIIAGADEITRHHLERLADACERRGVPLTLLFRHLRDDAALGMIGGGATAFMRLGNHHEAEQAASFIGRHHKFVLSGWTATHGSEHTTTRGTTQTWGTAQSRGHTATSGWTEDHLLSRSASGSRTRSREYSRNYGFAAEQSQSDGTSWSDAASTQRVYEYTVEPAVMQNLPDNALLLAARPAGTSLQPVECHPATITLPHVSTTPLPPPPARPHPGVAAAVPATQARPEIAPRHPQPQWPLRPANPDIHPAWPPRQQSRTRWPTQNPPSDRYD